MRPTASAMKAYDLSEAVPVSASAIAYAMAKAKTRQYARLWRATAYSVLKHDGGEWQTVKKCPPLHECKHVLKSANGDPVQVLK